MAATDHELIDFDLHGLAGVRLVDADARDVATVGRQLGELRRPLGREPDIVLRFVDRLPLRGRLRYLGLDDAAFTDDAFLVLRSRHKAPARVQLPLDRVGGQIEIVCERGLPAVPLLIPILNLTVLANGVLPLHASAFLHEGVGVVTTGWSKGGKTEALLAFAAHGASYVGDEWVYVAAGGSRVHGIPEPVRLWDWHLRQLPHVRERIGRGNRLRVALLARGADAASGVRRPRGLGRLARRALPLLERQLGADVPPELVFAAAADGVPFDRLFLMVSHDAPEITVEDVDPVEVADRMEHSLQYERASLTAYYRKFRFAFPGVTSPVLEEADERERTLLRQIFEGKPAWAVGHPYPVSLEDLYAAMRVHV